MKIEGKRAEGRARERAEAIIQVRAGVMTAQEAARKLGVSRKTYYKWEARALQGMVGAVEEQAKGRPPAKEDPEKEQLRRERDELQARVKVLEQRQRIRELLGKEGAGGEAAKKKAVRGAGSGGTARVAARGDGMAVPGAVRRDGASVLDADAVDDAGAAEGAADKGAGPEEGPPAGLGGPGA
jgi:transposase